MYIDLSKRQPSIVVHGPLGPRNREISPHRWDHLMVTRGVPRELTFNFVLLYSNYIIRVVYLFIIIIIMK